MELKAAALIFSFLAIAGAQQADVISADQVADVVWKYFTQLGSNAKDTVDQLQQSEISQQLHCLFHSLHGRAKSKPAKPRCRPGPRERLPCCCAAS